MSVQSTIFLCLFACLMVAWTIVDNGQAVPVETDNKVLVFAKFTERKTIHEDRIFIGISMFLSQFNKEDDEKVAIIEEKMEKLLNANHNPWNRMAAVGASVKNERVKRSAYYYPDAYDRELQRLFSDYATDRKRAIVDSLGGDYLIRKRES
uniref:RxLR effector protein n=1 Tax=Romanomermis culicivorax TaxID=13658 RepID=A0A915HJK1_ROMCU